MDTTRSHRIGSRRRSGMAGKKLQGQVAIVTGAGRGIGAATARRLAAAGASVVLAARSEEEVEALAAELRKKGSRAIAVAADVSDLAGVEEIVESALEQFDRVDILVNNAGVIWPLEEVRRRRPGGMGLQRHDQPGGAVLHGAQRAAGHG